MFQGLMKLLETAAQNLLKIETRLMKTQNRFQK